MAQKNDKENGEPVMQVSTTGEGSAVRANGVPDMAEMQPGRVRAFMLAKFPERPWTDDKDLEDGVADWMAQADKSLDGYRAADEKLRIIAETYPEIMAISEDLAKNPGMPLGVAIRRNIDEAELEVSEEDAGFEDLRKSREQRAERSKASKAYQEQLDKNLEDSRKIAQQYLTDNEVPEEESAALGKYVDDIMGDYLNGRVTPAVLDMFRNALNYSKAVADAREVGKVEGMNAKLDAERQRKQTATDGLPGPGSSTGQMAAPKPAEPRDIFDDILARGERRRRMMD